MIGYNASGKFYNSKLVKTLNCSSKIYGSSGFMHTNTTILIPSNNDATVQFGERRERRERVTVSESESDMHNKPNQEKKK